MNNNAAENLNWPVISYKKSILCPVPHDKNNHQVIFDSNGIWNKVDLNLNNNGLFSIESDNFAVENYDFKNAFEWTMGRIAGRNLLLGVRVEKKVFVYQFVFASDELAFNCLEKLSDFIDDGGQILELSQTQATLNSQNDMATCKISNEKVNIDCIVDDLSVECLPDWPLAIKPVDALEKYLLEPNFIDFVKNVQNTMEIVRKKVVNMTSTKKL